MTTKVQQASPFPRQTRYMRREAAGIMAILNLNGWFVQAVLYWISFLSLTPAICDLSQSRWLCYFLTESQILNLNEFPITHLNHESPRPLLSQIDVRDGFAAGRRSWPQRPWLPVAAKVEACSRVGPYEIYFGDSRIGIRFLKAI